MKIRYAQGIARVPQPSLGGGVIRHRPILPVLITGPLTFALRDGLLDSGADDTVFPDRVAKQIGVDLGKAIPHPVSLAGRGILLCRFAPARLRITDGRQETYEWQAVIGFAPIALRYALLGHAGFLQYFDAEFRGADREVVLTPNPALPSQQKTAP